MGENAYRGVDKIMGKRNWFYWLGKRGWISDDKK